MDIALVTYPADTDPAGIGVVIQNLVENILRLDKKNNYYLLHFKKTDNPIYRHNEVLYHKIKYMPCMFSDSLYLYKNSNRFDIIHRFSPGGFIYKVKSKLVVTIHDLFFYKNYAFNKKMILRNFCGRYFNRSFISKADAIVTISEFSRQEIVRTFNVDTDKVRVIHCATKSPPKIESEHYKKVLHEKYGISGNYILFVSTIEPRKNLLSLVKAYEILRSRYLVKCGLVVVGKKGWDYKTVLDYIDRSPYRDSIKLVGFVPSKDLSLFYWNASLFVYPSLMEGFGIPPLEAMAHGCPTLTSNTSSLPEVVGDPRMMFTPNNINEIAQKCLEILTDPDARSANIRTGAKNVKRFSWEKSAKQLIELYNSLAS